MKNKQNKKTTNQSIIETMLNSKGRYFGLYTKSGDSLNARFVQETPSYVTVYDRNRNSLRKFLKTNISGVYFQGTSVGEVF
jgi:hypothetical protein